MNPTRLHAIMSGDARDLRARLARVAMSCASPFYRAAVGVRNAMFDLGIRKPKKLPRPVISIGNITTGGTGKTPMVIEITRRLVAMGHKPAVLLRGYQRRFLVVAFSDMDDTPPGEPVFRHGVNLDYVSDETLLLKAALEPLVPVQAHPKRWIAADWVLAYRSEVDTFVLDDGFQHRQVARDLDIVLVDATEPFGHRHLLPRGMLREPMSRLSRADVVCITRADHPWKEPDLKDKLRRNGFRGPVLAAQLRWSGHQKWGPRERPKDAKPRRSMEVPQPTGVESNVDQDELKSLRVVAFCGVGNPQAFHQNVKKAAGEVVAFRAFPDHFQFDEHRDVLTELQSIARQFKADAFVTTEKDWVKIKQDSDVLTGLQFPVYRPLQTVELIEGDKELTNLLRARLAVGP